MSPLSAIHPSLPAELQTLSPAGGLGAVGKIPTAELEQISTAGLAPVEGPSRSFASLLGHMVNEVNAKQAASGEAVSGLLSGQNVSLHQAMIAMEEASVSFQLMVEVRNKLLESYQELMRMSV